MRPVKEFRVRVPAAYKNVEITGAQIRRRDETNGEWRVELQSKVRGEYLLTVTWELPRSGQTNLVELAGIQALGVEREAGYVAIIARPPLAGQRPIQPASCSARSTCASCRRGRAGRTPRRCWRIVTCAPATSWRWRPGATTRPKCCKP